MKQPHEFEFVGAADRVSQQSRLAEECLAAGLPEARDHALDVVRLSAQGYQGTAPYRAAVAVLVACGHWTPEYAAQQPKPVYLSHSPR